MPTIADYKSCNAAALIAAASCLWSCFSEEEILAIELYVRAKDLAINGGPDYTGASGIALLVKDAKGWNNQVLDCAKRQGVALYIDLQNVIESATEAAVTPPPSTASGLKPLSSCYQCLPYEQKKNLLLYLKCRLNALDEPE